MKKKQSPLSIIATIIFVLLAILFISVGISGIVAGDVTSVYDATTPHAIFGLALAFLGMANVSFSRQKDGIDALMAMVVNGLFGLGTLFALLGSGVAFTEYPEKYDWGVFLVVGGLGTFITLLAPLLHNRMSHPLIVDESKRIRLSTAATLSLILFVNLLSIIAFHVWVLFLR